MSTDTPQPQGLAERALRRGAARWWWGPLVAGIIWFVIAWLVLRANVTSLATVGVLVGAVLLVAAVTEGALGSIMIGGWRVLQPARVSEQSPLAIQEPVSSAEAQPDGQPR